MNVDTSPAALVQRRHIGKYIAFGYSFEGVRRVLAQDQRIRDRAKRFGLKARHHRVVGGWSLICAETGGVVVERSFEWEIAEFLTEAQNSPTRRRLLECVKNVLKLKAAIEKYAATEGRLDAML